MSETPSKESRAAFETAIAALEAIEAPYPPQHHLYKFEAAVLCIWRTMNAMPIVYPTARLHRAGLRAYDHGYEIEISSIDWTDYLQILLALARKDRLSVMITLERRKLLDETDRRRCWEKDVEGLKKAAKKLRNEIGTAEPIFVEMVTIDQIAAAVHRSKRTLEHYRDDGRMPKPTVKGGSGRPDLWPWREIKAWLEGSFGIGLPDRFPASRAAK